MTLLPPPPPPPEARDFSVKFLNFIGAPRRGERDNPLSDTFTYYHPPPFGA